MLGLPATKLLMVEGIEHDPVLRARAERLRAHIPADEIRTVTDEELNAIMGDVLANMPRHGMTGDIRPVVILNRFRFDDSEEECQRRIEAYPHLSTLKLNGYGGFDWRPSGSEPMRKEKGLVCQPAWHIHTIVGCHFRCAYCNLGWFVNLMMNIEEYVARLDGFLARCPEQKLFQWDNYTDTVCFEPEYGAAKELVEYFAHRPGQALELYVGKSDNVDFLLDFDHRGHTVCCWSLAGETQCSRFEPRSAPMAARIEAMRKCQDAGYPVRVRLSPIVPVKNWREENRDMLGLLFSKVEPDVLTIETIRFLDHPAMAESFDLELLDPECVRLVKETEGQEYRQGCELPHAYRKQIYDLIIGETTRLRPEMPIAFCRETFEMWDDYRDYFSAHGQNTDKYFCNCGPHCAPATAAG
jgi:DNA repair photolyase